MPSIFELRIKEIKLDRGHMKHIFNEVHYELTRKIAEGGMGMSIGYPKRDWRISYVVVIKLTREEYSAIEEFRNNFIGEAKLVADLIHTNIVQTYHLGKIGEQYFMTMEFVTGWNPEEFLDRHVETEQYIPLILAVFIVSRYAADLDMHIEKKMLKADSWALFIEMLIRKNNDRPGR